MSTVTLSPKYQVVIPRSILQRIRLQPGDQLHVISFDDRIELVPVQPLRNMRGLLRGLDATFTRDENDRI